MRFSSLYSCLAVAAVLAGCDPTEVTLDGGLVSDDAGGPSGRLELVGDPTLSLVVGEEAPIEAVYTEAGVPVSGRDVRFALEGTAHDSTVGDLVRSTDARGHAGTMVRAGTTASAFRVRIGAERTAAIYVNVSVGTEGFGTLEASASYAGRREDGARRAFRVYTGTSCSPPGGYPTFPDRASMVDAPETDARWTLPVGLSYTIVVELRGDDGTVLASACADGVELVADAETRVELTLRDAPLQVAGAYEATVALHPGAAAASLIDEALGEAPSLAGGEAALYLDALEAELRVRGEETAADLLASERAAREASLDGALTDDGAGPRTAVDRLADALATRLALVRLEGPLSLSTTDGALDASWTLEAIEVGPAGDPDAPPPTAVELDALATAPAPTVDLAWRPETDRVDVEQLAVPLDLGAVVRTVLSAWIDDADGPLLMDGAGCDVLATWIADEVLDACDAACAADTCARALETLAAELVDAVAVTDRLTVAVSGSLVALDDDGDLFVDRLEGSGLGGAWGADDDENRVTADVVSARLVE